MKKISAIQLCSLLVSSRIFSEAMSFPYEPSPYGMQRFSVIFTAKLILLLLFVPLILFSRKYDGQSVFSVILAKSRICGFIYGGALSFLLTVSAAYTLSRLQFYTTSTIFNSAPSLVFILITLLVCAYGVYKGIEAVGRASLVISVVLIGFIVVVTVAVSGSFETDFLYPKLIERPDDFLSEVITELSKNTEIYIFLIAMGFTNQKPHRAVYFGAGALLLIIELLAIIQTLVFGPYTEELNFPFFILSALSDVVVFQRLDGIDVILWTLISIIRICACVICVKEISLRLVGKKAATVSAGAALVLIGSAAYLTSLNLSLMLLNANVFINTAVIAVTGSLIPLLLLFMRKETKNA